MTKNLTWVIGYRYHVPSPVELLTPEKSSDFSGRGAETERADTGDLSPVERSEVCGDEKGCDSADMKAKIGQPNHKRGYTLVELLLVMLLLTLFGITVVAIIQSGSTAYAKVAENRAAESDARIAIGYIDVRVRQNDVYGGIQLKDNPFGEGSALTLRENFEGTVYVTWIFYLDGVLYECPLLNEGDMPTLDFSQPIASLDDFMFERVSENAFRQTAVYPIRKGANDSEKGEISTLISLRAANLDFAVEPDEE